MRLSSWARSAISTGTASTGMRSCSRCPVTADAMRFMARKGAMPWCAANQASSPVRRAAIEAEQQFWLADAALQASVIGRPTNTSLSVIPAGTSPAAAGH